jgi:disulfide oxidoreductase YuzD
MEQPIEKMPKLDARPYIMKCVGGNLPVCSSCTRLLAPVAKDGQRWVEPDIKDGVCGYAAEVSKCAQFYQPLSTEAQLLLERDQPSKVGLTSA